MYEAVMLQQYIPVNKNGIVLTFWVSSVFTSRIDTQTYTKTYTPFYLNHFISKACSVKFFPFYNAMKDVGNQGNQVSQNILIDLRFDIFTRYTCRVFFIGNLLNHGQGRDENHVHHDMKSELLCSRIMILT